MTKRPYPNDEDLMELEPLSHDVEHRSHDTHRPSPSEPQSFGPEHRDSPTKDDANGEKICYGMLKDITVRLFQAKFREILKSCTQPWLFLGIHRLNDMMILRPLNSSIDVGFLNLQTGKNLASLVSGHSVYFHAMVPGQEEALTEAATRKARSDTLQLNCDVLVYGSVEDDAAAHTADALSSHRLFLQRPHANKLPYRNPQWLKSHSESSFDDDMSESEGATDDFEATAQHHLNVAEENINEHHKSQCEPASIIKTTLRQHQRQALHFMMCHEDLKAPETLSLWQQRSPDDDRFYKHIIVDHLTATKPRAFQGGLLADDMGLGKTLSVLALIASTLREAHEHASTSSAWNPKSKSTLVIVPSVLAIVDIWREEINKHLIPNTVKLFIYHGQRRDQKAQKLMEADIVLTTYATATADFYRGQRRLQSIDWFRVVLDEAHLIRYRQTKQYNAVIRLQAARRWCITGTPIQNRIDDFGALVSFLKVPFLEDPHTFRKYVASKAMTRTSVQNSARFQLLMSAFRLRRTKRVDHVLDPILVETSLCLPEHEKKLYKEVAKAYHQRLYRASLELGTESTGSILSHLQELRILCNHGTFKVTVNQSDNGGQFQQNQPAHDMMTAVCDACFVHVGVAGTEQGDENEYAGQQTTCGHFLCPTCLLAADYASWTAPELEEAVCPKCEAPFTLKALNAAGLQSSNFIIEQGSSVKLEELVRSIERLEHDAKSIVFSAWARSLELAAEYLRGRNIKVRVIHGILSVPARRAILEEFRSFRGKFVLLMTLGTGGEGLTLTDANHIYILEPQWNPQIEQQAIGRAVRMGQTRRVTVTRFIIDGSVEQYVRRHQERKLHLVKNRFDDISGEEKKELFDELLKETLQLIQ